MKKYCLKVFSKSEFCPLLDAECGITECSLSGHKMTFINIYCLWAASVFHRLSGLLTCGPAAPVPVLDEAVEACPGERPGSRPPVRGQEQALVAVQEVAGADPGLALLD